MPQVLKRASRFAALIVFAGLASAAVTPPASSATLDVRVENQSQILYGATGVNVGGELYDVSFTNGTFNDLFDDGNALAFNNFDDALLAAQALLDQVLINGFLPDQNRYVSFDSSPSLTNGLQGSNSGGFIRVPYATRFVNPFNFVEAAEAFNDFATFGGTPGGDDEARRPTSILTTTNDSADYNYITYAVFTQSAVPEPASLTLLSLATLTLLPPRRRPAP